MCSSGRDEVLCPFWPLLNLLPCRRELIPDGETGGLVIFDDTPNFWDAWGVSV